MGRIIDRCEVAAPEKGHADRHHEAHATFHQGGVREFGFMGGDWAVAADPLRGA
jgi:hypothetical protein